MPINVNIENGSGLTIIDFAELFSSLLFVGSVATDVISNNTSTSFQAATTFNGGIPFTAVVTGEDFTYAFVPELAVVGGTVTSIDFIIDGQSVGTMTDINIDLQTIIPLIQAEVAGTNISALEDFLFNLDWSFNLSDIDDVLDPTTETEDGIRANFRGDDTFNGNGGDDILFSGDGNDTVNGGAGNDVIGGGTRQ